jgi:hypothetical protein
MLCRCRNALLKVSRDWSGGIKFERPDLRTEAICAGTGEGRESTWTKQIPPPIRPSGPQHTVQMIRTFRLQLNNPRVYLSTILVNGFRMI